MISLRTALALFVATLFAIARAALQTHKASCPALQQSRHSVARKRLSCLRSRLFRRPGIGNFESVKSVARGCDRSESGNHEAAIEKSAHGRGHRTQRGKNFHERAGDVRRLYRD